MPNRLVSLDLGKNEKNLIKILKNAVTKQEIPRLILYIAFDDW